MVPAVSAAEPGAVVARLLAEAVRYRAFSLLFRPPREGSGDEVRGILDPLPGQERIPLLELAAFLGPGLEEEYNRAIGAGGVCPTGESDFRPWLFSKGPLLADVAAFYRAFGFDPAAEMKESPDHVAVELSFAAFLALKEAYAVEIGETEKARLVREALTKFRAEHLDDLIASLAERLAAAAPEGFHARAAALARGILLGAWRPAGALPQVRCEPGRHCGHQ